MTNLKPSIVEALKQEDFSSAFQECLNWIASLRSEGKTEEAIQVLQEVVGLEGQYEKRGFFLEHRTPSAAKFKEHFNRVAPQLHEQLGEFYLEKKEYGKAVDDLKKAIELSPGNTQAHYRLGIAYLGKGQPDKAKGSFQEVVRFQGPEMAPSFEKLAEIYSSQKNLPQAVVWLKAAAEVYTKNGEIRQAIQVLEKSLEHLPGNQEALNHLVELYSKEGDREDAIRTAKRLSNLYAQQGLFDKVVGLYEKLVEWEPENLEIVNQLIEIYRKSLSGDPENLRTHIKLIENLLRRGSVDEVVSEYLRLIHNYTKMGLWEEAIRCCEKVLSFDADSLEAREMLANLYREHGRPEDAGKELARLAETLREHGQEERAKSFYQEAMALVGSKSEWRVRLAKSLMGKGDAEEAIQQFQEVLEESPEDPEALWEIGNLWLSKQEYEKSDEFFRRLLKLQPERLEVKERLVEAYEAQLLREMEEPSLLSV